MDRKQKFFICKHYDNSVGMVFNSGTSMVYCGEKITELVANATDAATEKCVPVVTIEGSTVTAVVSSVERPTLPRHYIQWIYLLTTTDGHRTTL